MSKVICEVEREEFREALFNLTANQATKILKAIKTPPNFSFFESRPQGRLTTE